jgi:hypothetical protein
VTVADATTAAARRRRNQRWMIAVVLIILAVSSLLYVYMKQVAAARAKEHKHSFYEYVLTNHIGTLTEIDTGTGLDPMSYIVTLHHSIADSAKAAFAEDLMKHYVQYDHGSVLSIVYLDPKTNRRQPLAECRYDRLQGTVTITVTFDSGQTQVVRRQVNW